MRPAHIVIEHSREKGRGSVCSGDDGSLTYSISMISLRWQHHEKELTNRKQAVPLSSMIWVMKKWAEKR